MTWFRAGSSVAELAIRKTVPLSRLTDNFLYGTSSVYLEELQRAWDADPNSVDESWDNFFRNFMDQAATSPGISGQTIQESMRLLLLVRAYQVYGHMKAKLDPLGLEQREIPDDFDPALYGFSEADLAIKRGRLNVLGNVVRKPLRQIFSEFSEGIRPIEEVGLYTGTANVKYHLGTSYDRPTRGGKRIHLSLVANPGHLEAMDPIVGDMKLLAVHSLLAKSLSHAFLGAV
ncbi:2-oxoglutarate dehydrogenase, mitochondrial-like protein [Tanacetum coccineum]